MTYRRAIDWTLAAIMATVLSTAYLLDGPSDGATEQATSLSMQDALRAAQHTEKRERAAADMCGNGIPVWNAENEVSCKVRKALRAAKVAL